MIFYVIVGFLNIRIKEYIEVRSNRYFISDFHMILIRFYMILEFLVIPRKVYCGRRPHRSHIY